MKGYTSLKEAIQEYRMLLYCEVNEDFKFPTGKNKVEFKKDDLRYLG
ncbi:MAG: hypothetical protein ABIC91_04570 [Nanoarchaeota archaeon]|nr:hypothetical protein [Nanoarchaeota archaeon]MBU1030245.1 hypothetical protein [Nanoarchaeota archaeon]MBU1850670.1 hypothetical protein [Nanoarchaeota archaeon]